MTTQCMKTTLLLVTAFLIIAFPLSAGLILFSGTASDLGLAADVGQQTTVAISQPVQGTTSVGPCFGMFCALETVEPEKTGG